MNDPFLVRMLDAVAQLDEQFEAVANRQALPVAIGSDGFTAHILQLFPDLEREKDVSRLAAPGAITRIRE